ncbi:MAG: hypothetical protein DRG71_00475 [Deltaproteobacteria bacterium]|nr:MAG: hypothetical protein DRG71_00475 [Deltaproteobacteria bacterium]
MAFRIKLTEQCQENYHPSQRTMRRFWLGTKKGTYSCGGVQFPGLVDYNEDLWPAIGFTVGFFFEIIGLALLFQAGLDWRAAVALGLCDIIFAILRHRPVADLCRLRNTLLLTAAGPAQNAIRTSIRKKKTLVWILSIPIIIISLIKIVNFIGFIGGLDPTGLLVIVSYIIVAVIHLTLTGYFAWWLLGEIWDFMEHRGYKRAIDAWGITNPGVFPPYPPPVIGAPHEIAGPKMYGPITIPNLHVPGYVVGRHLLINNSLLQDGNAIPREFFRNFDSAGTGPAMRCTAELNNIIAEKSVSSEDNTDTDTYTLFTYGVFTDNQLESLCNLLPVPPYIRERVAREFIRHQFSILGLAAPAATGDAGGK